MGFKKRFLSGLTIALLIAVVMAPFWRVAFLREALYYFDITDLNMPLRDFYGRAIRAGRLPLWTTDLYMGYPIFAEGQAGPLYPPNLILFPWLPNWVAFNLSTVGHLVGIAFFTYLFIRRFASRAGAFVGAVVMTFSAFVVEHNIHTSMLNQVVWLPIILLTIELAASSGDGRWLLGGALAFACQLLAGHQQVAIFSMLIGAGYVVLVAFGRGDSFWKSLLRAIGANLVIYGLGFLLAGVQVVPTLELLTQSVRSAGLSSSDAAWCSWPPMLFSTLFFPSSFGSRMYDTQWLDAISPQYHEMTFYCGIVGLFLACYGVVYGRDRRVCFFFGLGAFGILLGLGRFGVIWEVFHRLPILRALRIPARASLFTAFSVGVLAAFGVDALRHPRKQRLSPWVTFAFSMCVALGLAVIGWCYGVRLLLDATPSYPNLRVMRLISEVRSDIVLRLVLLIAAIGGVSLAMMHGKAVKWCVWGLAASVVLDGILFAHGRVPTTTPSYWERTPELVPLVQRHQELGRLIHSWIPIRLIMAYMLPGWRNDRAVHALGREAIFGNLPLMHKIYALGGKFPLTLRRWDTCFGEKPLYDPVMFSDHLITCRAMPEEDWSQLRGGVLRLYKRKVSVPRVWISHDLIRASSFEEAIGILRRELRSGRGSTVLELPKERALPAAFPPRGQEKAEIVDYRSEEITARVHATAPGVLIVTDTFYPGWRAWVDGIPTQIFPVNVLFRGVFVEAGTHEVRFRYQPFSFSIGVVLSAAGAGMLILLSLVIPHSAFPGLPSEVMRAESSRPRKWIAVGFLTILTVSAVVNWRLWKESFRRFPVRAISGCSCQSRFSAPPHMGADRLWKIELAARISQGLQPSPRARSG